VNGRAGGEAGWIAGDEALAAACAGWLECRRLALDTEFERVRTYYPRAGLVQVHDGRSAWLIDPLAIARWEPLAAVLRAPAVLKVMHACAEDCELLRLLAGAVPEPIFDTQVAAAFAGLGTQRGYADLVAALLGREVPRGETRSDWRARPLSPAQLRYAVADVASLLELHEALAARLARHPDHARWAAEETRRIAAERARDPDPERAYLRVRGAADLAPRELAALRALAAWREREARDRDRPRRRLLSDEALLELARTRPGEAAALRVLEAGQARHHGEALLGVLNGCAGAPAPPAMVAGRRATATIRALARAVRRRAAALGLPPELLAPRRLLEAIALHGGRSPADAVASALEGWRHEALGETLREILEELADES